MYSFCEASFQIREGDDESVITLSAQQPNSESESDASPNNRDHVQVSEVVRGDGSALPPLIILASNHAHQAWSEGLEAHVSLFVSDTGCCSVENPICRWIRHFDHHSSLRQKGEYRLLLMTKYRTHTSREFLSYCEERKIILLFLNHHTGYLVDPLGKILQNATEGASQAVCQNLTKEEFLSSIVSIRHAALTSSAILSGFRDTGLIPYCPDIVLDKLREERPATPVNSSSPASCHRPWATPKTPQQFTEYQERLTNLVPGSDYYNEGISKLLKGSLAQSHLLEGLKAEFGRRTSSITDATSPCSDGN